MLPCPTSSFVHVRTEKRHVQANRNESKPVSPACYPATTACTSKPEQWYRHDPRNEPKTAARPVRQRQHVRSRAAVSCPRAHERTQEMTPAWPTKRTQDPCRATLPRRPEEHDRTRAHAPGIHSNEPGDRCRLIPPRARANPSAVYCTNEPKRRVSGKYDPGRHNRSLHPNEYIFRFNINSLA
mgnify:CR=1 FL=1